MKINWLRFRWAWCDTMEGVGKKQKIHKKERR